MMDSRTNRNARSTLTISIGVLLLLVLGLAQVVQAERASVAEMQAVAEHCLTDMVQRTGAWAGSSNPRVTAVHEIVSDGVVLARYYDISPQGFVLVPVLKEMVPVKAYSESHDLTADQEEGFLKLITDQLATRAQLFVSEYGSLDAVQPRDGTGLFGVGQRALWDRFTLSTDEFKADLAARKAEFREAGPLTTTSWHQGEPYNNYCPEGDSGRTVVGCVATATAQILAYWQWPATGYGTQSYIWDGDTSCGGESPIPQTLSAEYTDAYDWANIPDSVDEGYTPEQAAALAELNYEVGVAFQMSYGHCGSAAATGNAVIVFPGHFKFKNTAIQIDRSDYDLAGWYQAIQTEIDAGRVIQYRINLHSIVCDGYRLSGGLYQYHMNYGWGGGFNAWYTMDSLYCGWIEGDICPANEEFMIVNITPQTNPVLSVTGCDVTDSDGDGRLEAGESVDMSLAVHNAGWEAVHTVGQMVSLDPYVTVTTGACAFADTIHWGERTLSQDDFAFNVLGGFADPHVARVAVTALCDGGHSVTDTLQLLLGVSPGFADNAEAGEGDWQHNAMLSNFVDQWHLETQRANSGSTSWKCGGAGASDYDNSCDGALVTRPILLSPNSRLSFWHWLEAEEDAAPGQAWDGGVVLVSAGAGVWQQLEPAGGYSHTIIDNPACPFAGGTPCFSGSIDWTQTFFDLSAYSGLVQIMFRFGSDGYTTAEGWYVDDIEITSDGCCTGPSVGNVDGSADNLVTMGDLTVLIDHLFISYAPLFCVDAANVDMSSDNQVTMGDLTVLIDHLFVSYAPLSPCP